MSLEIESITLVLHCITFFPFTQHSISSKICFWKQNLNSEIKYNKRKRKNPTIFRGIETHMAHVWAHQCSWNPTEISNLDIFLATYHNFSENWYKNSNWSHVIHLSQVFGIYNLVLTLTIYPKKYHIFPHQLNNVTIKTKVIYIIWAYYKTVSFIYIYNIKNISTDNGF